MNQERMRCILFQRSEWPMGVGLSSKHWALRSHSFSAERTRRAGESEPLSASTRRFFLRAQIPRNNKLEPELQLHSPQTQEEKFLDLSSLVFIVFLPTRFLSHFYNYSCGTSITGLSCRKIGLQVRSSSSGAFPPSSIRAPPWIYCFLSLDDCMRESCWTLVKYNITFNSIQEKGITQRDTLALGLTGCVMH